MMYKDKRNMYKTLLMTAYILNMVLQGHGNIEPCPIGFRLSTDSSLCYRIKGPETFDEKFSECEGNRYSYSLLQNNPAMRLDFISQEGMFWTDFISFYAGGILFDQIDGTSYTHVSQENQTFPRMCIMVYYENNTLHYKEGTCEEKIYRYCVINSYDVSKLYYIDSGCDNDFIRFVSPLSTCLITIEGAHRGSVRANWKQAQMMCNARNATLIQKGWRYANNKYLDKNYTDEIPLGIFVEDDNTIYWSQPDGDERKVPIAEENMNLEGVSEDPLATFGSLKDSIWNVVDPTHVFFSVICEKQAATKELMDVKLIKRDNIIVFELPTGVDNNPEMVGVECITDSEPLPNDVTQNYTIRTNFLQSELGFYYKDNPKNGYYHCYAYNPTTNIRTSEMKSYLYIDNEEDLRNVYAIKINTNKKYPFNNLHRMNDIWMRMLSKYMFLLTKNKVNYGVLDLKEDFMRYKLQDILKNDTSVFDRSDVYKRSEIKRVFLDRQTAVLHVEINPGIKTLLPIHWESIEILSMKPVYWCNLLTSNNVQLFRLGEEYKNEFNCRTYTCVGDFNEGVNIIETATPDCTEVYRLDTDVDVSSEEIPSTVLPTEFPTSTLEEETVTETSSTESASTTTMSPTTVEVPITVTQPPPRPRPPQQQVDDVIHHLQDLLKQNPTQPISVKSVNEAFDRVDEVLSLEEAVEIPSDFLTMLDSIGARADLNGTTNVTTVRGHVAMVVTQSEVESPVRGLRIASRAQVDFMEDAFHLLSERDNEEHLQTESSEAVVFLPESVAMSERRISFVVFRDDRPFLPAPDVQHYNVNSRIVSIKVQDVNQFHNGEVVDIHLRPIDEDLDRNQSRSCGFWDFMDNGTGMWSQAGCVFIKATRKGLLDTCRCTHLTHFAEVLVPRVQFSPRNEKALEYLSIIGCSLSLLGLSVIGLTAALFRVWRREFTNKIWLNLCVAICLLILAFFVIVFARFEEYSLLCMFTGIVLHYSVVCSFCWMSIAAVISYKRLVQVFSRDATHKLLRACAFAYGTPFLIVGILLSVDPHAYSGQFQEINPTGAFCYPTDLALWLTVYTPVVIMLLVNCTLFILIVRSVFATKQIQRHGDASDAFRCASVAFLLVFLFGLPWLFGLFANLLVFSYLHTLTATFQGFVLFLFFIVGNKKTRELWMNKLKIKQTRKVPVSSSTGPRGQTVTIETNSTKPLSLGVDESRFS